MVVEVAELIVYGIFNMAAGQDFTNILLGARVFKLFIKTNCVRGAVMDVDLRCSACLQGCLPGLGCGAWLQIVNGALMYSGLKEILGKLLLKIVVMVGGVTIPSKYLRDHGVRVTFRCGGASSEQGLMSIGPGP